MCQFAGANSAPPGAAVLKCAAEYHWRIWIMANFPSNNAAFPGVGADSRSVFITRTYTHLVGGILGFILVELGLFESGLAGQIAQLLLGFNWFLILGAFMLTGWLA